MKHKHKMWMVVDKNGSPHAYTCALQRKQAKWHLTHNLWGASWDECARQGYSVVKVDVSYTFDKLPRRQIDAGRLQIERAK